MSEPQHPYTNAGPPAQDDAPPVAQAAPDSVAAIGSRLARLRESKGWTIEDVSARLKVSVLKLRGLEAGDFTRMPDTTFALGVVRSYAKMLGADPAPFVEALRRERGRSQPDLSMPASSGSDLPRGKVSLSLGSSGGQRRRSWLWGVAAVIVGVIALAMWRTNVGESSAWLARLKATASSVTGSPHSAPPANVTEGQTTSDEQNGASAPQGDAQAGAQAGDEAAAPAANAQTAPTQAATAPAETQQTQPDAVANAPAEAQAATPAPASPAAVVSAQPATAATAAATPSPGTSTFAIRVTQDTWVSVRQKDGKEVFSGLIHGSDARDIAGVAPLRITVGNRAGVASMTLDGQPVDPAKYASAKGNVARFVLP